MSSAASRQQQVRDILGPAVSALGYDLEDVQISQAGRRSVIRVIVDTDGGIDLDTAPRVVADGARILVAGSAIFRGGDPERATRELKDAALRAIPSTVPASR